MTCTQFLGEEADVGPDKRVSILSAPLANTVSWGKGTDQGPSAVIDASPALEIFDDELLMETARVGIETLAPLQLSGLSSEEACRRIYNAVGAELDRGRLPVLLGGEHTVTVPAVAACAARYPDLHVVQVDAHLDLRDQYEGDALSHACVMRRIDDLFIPFSQVGIRSFSREEWELVQRRSLEPYTITFIRTTREWVKQVCAKISGPVYITFDVDGLDPAIMPATGTPEPDGLTWPEATALLKGIAAAGKIVGLDCVEFAPYPGAHHAAFTVAKLLYRTLGYIFFDHGGKSTTSFG